MAKKKPAKIDDAAEMKEDVGTDSASKSESKTGVKKANVTNSGGSADGGYVVVARRYRPKSFGELVGQDHVGRALANAIETSRVGHAYLFTGARGVGKTSTARIFAKALNNPAGASAQFDGSSDIAEAIDAGEDVDVIEIDGASNRGIDEIRSLRANVGVRPSRARYKIYIIDEVHMLTGAAFNALLKTLEEPPEHVKFIFCTTDPEKIPITVLSRCQRFDFAPVEVRQIIGRLKEIIEGENATASEEALELIARRAAGSMRDSQSLLEQVMSFSDGHLDAETVHAMLGTADDTRLHAMAGAMANGDAAGSLGMLDVAIDAGVDAGRLAEQLLGYFRDLLAVTVGCDANLQRHTSAAMHDELRSLGEQWGLQTVLAVVGLIDQTLVRIRHSVYARVLLEATLVQICNLPNLQSIADLAAAASEKSGTTPTEKKKLASAKLPASAEPVSLSSADKLTSSRSPNSIAGVSESSPTSGRTGPDLSTDQKESTRNIVDEPSTAAAATVPLEQSSPSPVTNHRASLDQTRFDEAWPSVLKQLPDDTAAMVRQADSVSLRGQTVTVQFGVNSALTLRRCDTAAHREAIVAAMTKQLGQTLKIELAASKVAAAKPTEEVNQTVKVGKRERIKQIESHPLVCACIEQLDAEIMKIDHPRS